MEKIEFSGENGVAKRSISTASAYSKNSAKSVAVEIGDIRLPITIEIRDGDAKSAGEIGGATAERSVSCAEQHDGTISASHDDIQVAVGIQVRCGQLDRCFI